jgi:hypothetical protein
MQTETQLMVVVADIDAEDHLGQAVADTNEVNPGVFVMQNIDDTDGNKERDCDDTIVNGVEDLKDMVKVTVRKFSGRRLNENCPLFLSTSTEGLTPAGAVRLFSNAVDHAEAVTLPLDVSDLLTEDLTSTWRVWPRAASTCRWSPTAGVRRFCRTR